MSPAGFNCSAVRKGPFSTLAIHFLSITGRGAGADRSGFDVPAKTSQTDLKFSALLRQSRVESRKSKRAIPQKCQGLEICDELGLLLATARKSS
jgi:hypothetical protein